MRHPTRTPPISGPSQHHIQRHGEQEHDEWAERMGNVTIQSDRLDAVIFDLDGVITKTAAVHEVAWAEIFDRYLRERAEETGTSFEPFTSADYGEYVDGKPRYDGVQSFLASRGIELAWGDPSDPPEHETVCGLGNRKNSEFTRIVRERGVEPYESSVRFINELHERGFRTALFSSIKALQSYPMYSALSFSTIVSGAPF